MPVILLAGDGQEEVLEAIFCFQHLSAVISLILIIINYNVWYYEVLLHVLGTCVSYSIV